MGWATCGAGRLLALHTLVEGADSDFSTGLCLARFIRTCDAFPERLLRLFCVFLLFFTRCARHKSFARSRAQIKPDLCECLRVYIKTSARLIVNRHSVDLIILKPPSASYKETVGQQWNRCGAPAFFFFFLPFSLFFFPQTRPPYNLIHNNENLISSILKVSAHL